MRSPVDQHLFFAIVLLVTTISPTSADDRDEDEQQHGDGGGASGRESAGMTLGVLHCAPAKAAELCPSL